MCSYGLKQIGLTCLADLHICIISFLYIANYANMQISMMG